MSFHGANCKPFCCLVSLVKTQTPAVLEPPLRTPVEVLPRLGNPVAVVVSPYRSTADTKARGARATKGATPECAVARSRFAPVPIKCRFAVSGPPPSIVLKTVWFYRGTVAWMHAPDEEQHEVVLHSDARCAAKPSKATEHE